MKFFARKGYAVWRLDFCGYGKSDTLEDGFKINSEIDLLGWSFGTVSVAKFAAKYPEKVRKLILYAPIFNGLGATDVTEPFHKNTWEHAADDFQKLSDGSIDFGNGCRREIFSPETTRLICMEKIKTPVLIIEGYRDAYINRAALAEAVKNLPPDSEFAETSF